jgi:hypothetical protein
MLNETLDTVQHIPLNTLVTGGAAALIAFLAGLAFTSGAMKQIVGMFCLVVGTSVGMYVFRHRADVFGASAANISTDRLLMFSAIAGLVAYSIAKVVVHMLTALGILNIVGGLVGWRGALISAIPSGFLLWTSSTVLRLIGNLYGMETATAVAREGSRVENSFGAWANQARQAIDRSAIGSLVASMDPFAMRPTANLARLLILWPDKKLWPSLASNPKTSAVFSHPKIRDLGGDSAVRQCIERKDYAGLLQLKQVEATARYPDLEPKLSDPGLEEAMDTIVYGRAGKH